MLTVYRQNRRRTVILVTVARPADVHNVNADARNVKIQILTMNRHKMGRRQSLRWYVICDGSVTLDRRMRREK